MAMTAKLALYNEDRKNDFIFSLNDDLSTKETYRKLLKTIGKYEYKVNKDLYLMNAQEVLDMFSYLRLGSDDTAIVMLTLIKLYHKYAITEKLISNLDDVLSLTKEDVIPRVSTVKRKQQYIKNEDELRGICQFCANWQDSGLFVATFYGIDGYEHDSIVNLKKEDLDPINGGAWATDFEYELDETGKIKRDSETKEKVIKKSTRRFVEIPEEFLRILENAAKEPTYFKANNMSGGMKARSYELMNSPYIFRRAATREGDEERLTIDAQVVNQRMKKIITLFSGKKKYKVHQEDEKVVNLINRRNITRMNPQTVFISGIFNQFRKLEETEGREIQTNECEEVLRKYNVSPILATSYRNKYLSYKKTV
jgi:hypothetical protein